MVLRKPGACGKVLLLLCLMYFITYVDRVNIGTAASIIKNELHLTNTQLGLVFSAFAYPYALFQVFGGRVGDRFGARRTLFVCGMIWAAATVLTGLAGSLASLFLVRLLLGFGEGATFPTATRAMQNWTAPGRRGFAQGLTHSFSRLGNAVTPPVVALLIAWITWRGSFVVLGCVSFFWVLAWLWYFRDDPRDHKAITAAELECLPPFREPGAALHHAVPWKRLALRMLPVTIVYFCYGWTLWLYLNWLPSFFLQGYGLNIKNSALFASGVFFAGVIGDTLGGVLSDGILHRTGNIRLARIGVVLTGMLGACACLIPVFLTTDLTMIALLLSGGFFFLELTIGPIWSIPMDIAPQHAGTASGFMNTGSALAAIVSPLAFGLIVDLTGNWVLPFVGSIGLLLLGASLAFLMRPEQRFSDDEAAPPPVPTTHHGEPSRA
jgi:MFS family permease